MKTKSLILVLLLLASFELRANPLQTFENCTLDPMEGADGDSFRVRFPDGSRKVVRLYAVDCMETRIWDHADSRRLRAQRRYFGITQCAANSSDSIKVAKSFGVAAHQEVKKQLAKPFTVYTAFADGAGSGYHKRFYGFVKTGDGKDLGTHLVSRGLARAFGVYRQSPDGSHRDELRARLEDIELRAAKLGHGIWAKTNWETLLNERLTQRLEDSQLDMALDNAAALSMVDPNTAPRDKLMTLKGIGEIIALRIIENRPYKNADDLLRVKGIGPETLLKNQKRLPKEFHLPEKK